MIAGRLRCFRGVVRQTFWQRRSALFSAPLAAGRFHRLLPARRLANTDKDAWKPEDNEARSAVSLPSRLRSAHRTLLRRGKRLGLLRTVFCTFAREVAGSRLGNVLDYARSNGLLGMQVIAAERIGHGWRHGRECASPGGGAYTCTGSDQKVVRFHPKQAALASPPAREHATHSKGGKMSRSACALRRYTSRPPPRGSCLASSASRRSGHHDAQRTVAGRPVFGPS